MNIGFKIDLDEKSSNPNNKKAINEKKIVNKVSFLTFDCSIILVI